MAQSRSFRITDFDVSDDNKQMYRDFDKQRLAMGTETCPKTKKEHLQIFITFNRKYTFKQIKKILPTQHIEISKTADWNYELKEGNYEIQDNRNQGKRSDLDEAKDSLAKRPCLREIVPQLKSYQSLKMCEAILKYNEPKRPIQPIKFYWLYGETHSGKTAWAYNNYTLDQIFRPTTYKWWEGYDAHEVVLIDDFRKDWCKFHELLTLTDIYPFKVECKGGTREVQFHTIIITSPYHPKDTYDTREDVDQLLRRITNITEHKKLKKNDEN